MSSTVTNYVQPITQPLEGLHNAFTQMASQHRSMNERLRSHKNDLLSNSFAFQGRGAGAFGSLVDYYLNTSEKHMQAFDDAAGAVQTCHSTITSASSSADGAGLNQGLTNHVLSQVSHNDIIQRGSDPIQAVINDMQRTLSDMASSAGGIFGNLIHFHFGAAFDDFMHEGSDIKRMAGDMMGLLQDVGRVLGQWATSIYDAIQKCLPTIRSIAQNVINFLGTHWSMITNAISLAGLIKKFKDITDKAGPYLAFLGPVLNLLDGTDNTPAKFFGDLNGTVLGLVDGVGEVSLVFGAVSDGLQLLGSAQQYVIAPLIAGNNPTLEKEISEAGAALNKDAQGIDLGSTLTDIGNAAYDLNAFDEKGIGQFIQNPGEFISHPQMFAQTFTEANPGAALNDLKKAGGDAAGSLVSTFESGGDIAAIGIDDYDAAHGNQAGVASNNQFLEQQWRPGIDSFKQWLSSVI
jgi:hypothetical protein